MQAAIKEVSLVIKRGQRPLPTFQSTQFEVSGSDATRQSFQHAYGLHTGAILLNVEGHHGAASNAFATLDGILPFHSEHVHLTLQTDRLHDVLASSLVLPKTGHSLSLRVEQGVIAGIVA